MRYSRGFTLVEMLVAVCILSILIITANYNFQKILKTQEANRISIELRNIVSFGRSYALNNRRSLTLCGSSNGLLCDKNWSVGALIIEDANRNAIVDGADRVLRYLPLNLAASTIKWKGFSGNQLIFESQGITYASNGTFTYCRNDQESLYSRQVIVSRGARSRPSQDTNNDGVHEDSNGDPINCAG